MMSIEELRYPSDELVQIYRLRKRVDSLIAEHEEVLQKYPDMTNVQKSLERLRSSRVALSIYIYDTVCG